MAGTNFSTIFDKFLQMIDDYRLIALYQSSVADFETYLTAWLADAVVDFKNCQESLAYSTVTNSFTAILSERVQLVLARLMVKKWLEKEVRDVTQMNLHITDKDFKIYSEAQNLREKTAYLAQVTEEVSQMLNQYGFENISWADWLAGTFYTV